MVTKQEVQPRIIKPGNPNCQHRIHVIDTIGKCTCLGCGRKIDYSPVIDEMNNRGSMNSKMVFEPTDLVSTIHFIHYENYIKKAWW